MPPTIVSDLPSGAGAAAPAAPAAERHTRSAAIALAPNRLPARRLHVGMPIDHGGRTFQLGLGFTVAGHVGEVFLDGPKSGSDYETLLDDACIVLSKLLQRGEPLGAISRALAAGSRTDSLVAKVILAALGAEADLGAEMVAAYRAMGAAP